MKNILVILVSFIFFAVSYSQSIKDSLVWQKPIQISSENLNYFLNFKNGIYVSNGDIVPEYQKLIKIPLNSEVSNILFSEIKYLDLTDEEKNIVKNIAFSKINLDYSTETASNEKFISLRINSIIKDENNALKKLSSFKINYTLTTLSQKNIKTNIYADNSVLANGNWLKIGITSDGVYKLNYDELASYGVANENGSKVFTNLNSVLPELFTSVTSDDLKEIAVEINKGSDGVFNSGDYILFYAKSPNSWTPDYSNNRFYHKLHNYTSTNYYFITAGEPKIIETQNSLPETNITHDISTFNDYQFHEIETESVLKSGKLLLGEHFIPTFNNYNITFTFPNIDLASQVSVYGYLVGKSYQNTNFKIVSGSQSKTVSVPVITTTGYTFATKAKLDWMFNATNSNIPIDITFNHSLLDLTGEGWLDYIEVNAMRKLIFTNNFIQFRNLSIVDTNSITKFNITNTSNENKIWNITDVYNIKNIQYNINGSNCDFVDNSDSLKEYIIFNKNYLSPASFTAISNQNLHNLGNYDMIIISHPNFNSDANTLVKIHETEDNMLVKVLNPTEIYNEFSSGKPDISAIRNFIKMLYDKSSQQYPKYVLLYGDGSCDNRTSISSGNTNYILTYQSEESLTSTNSYVSDDFFAILDNNENLVNGLLDIGIGRFPVKNASESTGILNKIQQYYKNTSFGDWRNKICLIADDEDGNTHIKDADSLSSIIKNLQPVYNVNKIYLDAYEQTSTPSGERYPDVNKAFSNAMEQGALIVNYTGHGNELYLAHERILSINEINSWKNFKKLPLFITATCEFSRWDDFSRTTAGEYIFLNPLGGGIGMLTTTRLVYAYQNFLLNNAFYLHTFGNKNYRLGDMMRITKNNAGSSINKRNFSLLGDPAIKLPYADYNVITTKINNSPLPNVDTLKALSKIEIEGEIINSTKTLSNYNGIVYPTIYDKSKKITTLGNGGAIPYEFDIQNNIIFKGKATVTNGKFKFSFIVPKDIAYNYGKGKISYYAANDIYDASGYNADITIGGTNNSAQLDNKGPEIDLFLNDDKFIFGGLTNETPILLSKLFDESGINTVGNGIGHDISAIIDKNTANSINLNEFYESETDNYQKGNVNYQLSKLTTGNHSLSVKAWDVYNNSSEEYIEFIVAETANLAIDHILNYPNPFTTNTTFYFNHNQPNTNLKVLINIFTITGKLVKSLESTMFTTGNLSNPINWDGLDEFGDQLAKGVYIYKLSVKNENDQTVEKIEKLVILK